MHSVGFSNDDRIYSLHLTVQSVELVKGSLSSSYQISVSCDISEIPSVNCTLLFNKKKQDIGIIGSLKFEEKRPVAIASINLAPESFEEFISFPRVRGYLGVEPTTWRDGTTKS